jgi:hypothetical protein
MPTVCNAQNYWSVGYPNQNGNQLTPYLAPSGNCLFRSTDDRFCRYQDSIHHCLFGICFGRQQNCTSNCTSNEQARCVSIYSFITASTFLLEIPLSFLLLFLVCHAQGLGCTAVFALFGVGRAGNFPSSSDSSSVATSLINSLTDFLLLSPARGRAAPRPLPRSPRR